MGAIINRYELISLIISSDTLAIKLTEADRPFVSRLSDKELFEDFGRPQFKEFRKGYYILN